MDEHRALYSEPCQIINSWIGNGSKGTGKGEATGPRRRHQQKNRKKFVDGNCGNDKVMNGGSPRGWLRSGRDHISQVKP